MKNIGTIRFAQILLPGFILFPLFLFSQNNQLRQDTLKLSVLRERVDKEIDSKQYNVAKQTNDTLMALARKLNRDADIGNCYFSYGTIDRALGNKQNMIENMKNSIIHYKKEKLYKSAGKSYFIIGQTYIELKDENTAVEYFKESLSMRELASDSAGMANSTINIATLLYKTGDYAQSGSYFFKGLTLAQKLNNDKLKAICLSNLSHLSNKMNNYGQSLEYLNEALLLQRRLGNRQAESNVLTNFGTTYIEMKDYAKAKDVFSQALVIKEEIKDEKGIAGAYANMGIIAKNENDTALSRKYLNKAIAIAQRIGDKEIEANALSSLALLSSMNNSQDAEMLLIASLKKAKELNNPILIMANYQNLKEFYEKKGDPVKALSYATLYQSLNDSTFKESMSDKILELQTRYETAEKERQIAEITRQKLEQELRLNKANQLKYSLIGVSAFLLILALLLYSRFIIKKRSQEKLALINLQLNELNNTKDKLFSIISHDLKNSVSAFINITDSLNSNFDSISAENKRYLVNEMSGSANAMKNLFRNLLDWAKSQRNLIVVNKTEFSLNGLLNENIAQMQQHMNRRNITVHMDNSREMPVKTDKDILSTVLRNLLTNAIKYSPDGGKVEIGFAADKEYTEISVTDYGVGMEEPEINTILNTRVNVSSKPDVEGEKGAGLGLMLCKELLQKISGKMDIKSEKDKGSCFVITIPLNN